MTFQAVHAAAPDERLTQHLGRAGLQPRRALRTPEEAAGVEAPGGGEGEGGVPGAGPRWREEPRGDRGVPYGAAEGGEKAGGRAGERAAGGGGACGERAIRWARGGEGGLAGPPGTASNMWERGSERGSRGAEWGGRVERSPAPRGPPSSIQQDFCWVRFASASSGRFCGCERASERASANGEAPWGRPAALKGTALTFCKSCPGCGCVVRVDSANPFGEPAARKMTRRRET